MHLRFYKLLLHINAQVSIGIHVPAGVKTRLSLSSRCVERNLPQAFSPLRADQLPQEVLSPYLHSVIVTFITCARLLHGRYTAGFGHRIVVIELFRLLPKKSTLVPIIRLNTLSFIRCTYCLDFQRQYDYLLITSDADALTILSADQAKATFRSIHCETFGKKGVRRAVPA